MHKVIILLLEYMNQANMAREILTLKHMEIIHKSLSETEFPEITIKQVIEIQNMMNDAPFSYLPNLIIEVSTHTQPDKYKFQLDHPETDTIMRFRRTYGHSWQCAKQFFTYIPVPEKHWG